MPSSLSHAKTGYMVRSMRLIPRSFVRPAKESDCCCPRVKRVVTRSDDKAEKDAVKLNESLMKSLPWRKDTTPNDTWVAFGVRSAVASLGDEQRCGDGSTMQDKDFNDCVHVCLNGDTLPARKHFAMRLGTFATLNAGYRCGLDPEII